MARTVYGTDGEQLSFNTTSELRAKIKEVWEQLEPERLRMLVHSCPSYSTSTAINKVLQPVCSCPFPLPYNNCEELLPQ